MNKAMYKVLIAEDEPRSREGFTRIIDWEKYGFSIASTAKDGIEALNICNSQEINLLFTDIRMPKMDGLELSKTVKKEFPDMEVLLISAYREFEYAHRAIELGVKHYLLKPIEEAKLISALKSIKKGFLENQSDKPTPDYVKDCPEQLEESIRNIIADEYNNENLSVSYIADKLAYNSAYLGRAFKTTEGISIREYIKKHRIKQACKLIANTGMRIYEVSYAVGFNDVGTFYESFRNCMGCTPAEYREQQQLNDSQM